VRVYSCIGLELSSLLVGVLSAGLAGNRPRAGQHALSAVLGQAFGFETYIAGASHIWQGGLLASSLGGFGPGYWVWLLGSTAVVGSLASLLRPKRLYQLSTAVGGGLGLVTAIDWLVIGRLVHDGRPILWPTETNLPFLDAEPVYRIGLLAAANLLAAGGFAHQWRTQRHSSLLKDHVGRSAGYLPIEHYTR
jgi:hypothetical protein